MSPFGEIRNYAANSQAIQGGAGSTVGYQETAKREESGLIRELRYMEKNLSALEGAISILNARLDMVLIPAPTPEVGLRNHPSPGSSLTHQLVAFNALLADQLTRLDSITQGLDL